MVNNCVLIVDDELRMRKLIKDFLSAKAYSILEAEDGEKALEVFENNKNKIIMSDNNGNKTLKQECRGYY